MDEAFIADKQNPEARKNYLAAGGSLVERAENGFNVFYEANNKLVHAFWSDNLLDESKLDKEPKKKQSTWGKEHPGEIAPLTRYLETVHIIRIMKEDPLCKEAVAGLRSLILTDFHRPYNQMMTDSRCLYLPNSNDDLDVLVHGMSINAVPQRTYLDGMDLMLIGGKVCDTDRQAIDEGSFAYKAMNFFLGTLNFTSIEKDISDLTNLPLFLARYRKNDPRLRKHRTDTERLSRELDYHKKVGKEEMHEAAITLGIVKECFTINAVLNEPCPARGFKLVSEREKII